MSRRRGQGEGSIYQRSDGRWCAVLDLGIVNGRRRRKVRYGRTRKEAAAKLQEMLQQHSAGVDLAAERQTVTQFLAGWLALVKRSKKPETHASYERAIKYYIEPYIGHIQLDKLRAEHVQTLVNSLADQHSATTTRYARTVLVVALNHAVKRGYLPRNVAALVEPPRAVAYQATALTEQQAAALLAAVAGHRLEALYHLALGLGLRMGELIKLRWADIDLQAGCLTVREGKTPHAQRTLHLSPALVALLQQHWSAQQDERTLQGTNWQERGLAFPGQRGQPLLPEVVRNVLRRALARAGLPDMRFHDLRHTCISLLVAQGAHPRVIQQIAGHANINITMGVYAHVQDEQQSAALQNLSSRLHSGYTDNDEAVL